MNKKKIYVFKMWESGTYAILEGNALIENEWGNFVKGIVRKSNNPYYKIRTTNIVNNFSKCKIFIIYDTLEELILKHFDDLIK